MYQEYLKSIKSNFSENAMYAWQESFVSLLDSGFINQKFIEFGATELCQRYAGNKYIQEYFCSCAWYSFPHSKTNPFINPYLYVGVLPRQVGKTTLLLNLAHYEAENENVVFISPTYDRLQCTKNLYINKFIGKATSKVDFLSLAKFKNSSYVFGYDSYTLFIDDYFEIKEKINFELKNCNKVIAIGTPPSTGNRDVLDYLIKRV